jgi:hypothetical protein
MWPQGYIYKFRESLILNTGHIISDGKPGPHVVTQPYHPVSPYIFRGRVRSPQKGKKILGESNLGEKCWVPKHRVFEKPGEKIPRHLFYIVLSPLIKSLIFVQSIYGNTQRIH